MLTVTKIFEFDAAHYLPDYQGKCGFMHGHRWVLEVEISSVPKDFISYPSMIIDFKDLKKIIDDRVINILDHHLINDIVQIPTAENMVLWIKEQLILGDRFGEGICRIRLYETPTSFAEWRKE